MAATGGAAFSALQAGGSFALAVAGGIAAGHQVLRDLDLEESRLEI